MFIINEKITEAIKILKGFERSSQYYWLNRIDGLCDADKGFIYLYLGLNEVI